MMTTKTLHSAVKIHNADDPRNYKKDNSVFLARMAVLFAEFLGTIIVVFVTCMGCTQGMSGGNISPLQLSLVSGFAVMSAIQIFAHISGAYVNPAVTICALLMGEIPVVMVPVYIISQLAGALTGYALLILLTPSQHLTEGLCVTAPSTEISVYQAIVVETIATSIMCFGICSSWDPKNSSRTDSVALKIGFIVVMLSMAAGPYTGASMNPARSFGPAFWQNDLDLHLIYWIGPVVGAGLSGYFYRKIFLKKPKYYSWF